jgi:hypothetical protein
MDAMRRDDSAVGKTPLPLIEELHSEATQIKTAEAQRHMRRVVLATKRAEHHDVSRSPRCGGCDRTARLGGRNRNVMALRGSRRTSLCDSTETTRSWFR